MRILSLILSLFMLLAAAVPAVAQGCLAACQQARMVQPPQQPELSEHCRQGEHGKPAQAPEASASPGDLASDWHLTSQWHLNCADMENCVLHAPAAALTSPLPVLPFQPYHLATALNDAPRSPHLLPALEPPIR